MPNVILAFDNHGAARSFIDFMAEIGEQYYWDFMNAQELKDSSPNITALWFRFPAYTEKGYSPDSLGNYLIKTKLGRLDNKGDGEAATATVFIVSRRAIDEWEIVGVYDDKESALRFCLEKFYTDNEEELARLDKPVVINEHAVGQAQQ